MGSTQVQYTEFCGSNHWSLCTPVAPSSEPTGEPELQESQASISCVLTSKDFPNLFEKTKESVEAFISTKLKHTDIADTPIGSQRRKLLDLKVCKIIRRLSGELTQQRIDYIQRSELSSSLFFYLAASLLCTPIPSPYTSSKVSGASTPIITAGIIWMFAKCHTLKSTRTHVESEELTLGLEIHCTLKLTNNFFLKTQTQKFYVGNREIL